MNSARQILIFTSNSEFHGNLSSVSVIEMTHGVHLLSAGITSRLAPVVLTSQEEWMKSDLKVLGKKMKGSEPRVPVRGNPSRVENQTCPPPSVVPTPRWPADPHLYCHPVIEQNGNPVLWVLYIKKGFLSRPCQADRYQAVQSPYLKVQLQIYNYI
jgi:hypothetical protein